MIPRRLTLLLFAGLLACTDSSGPGDDLVGSWQLVGYSDAGVPATASGDAIFRSVGTFSIEGTLTFPGEPAESIEVSGTWSVEGDIVTLRTGNTSGRWAFSLSGSDVTLTLEGSQPPTTITLRRN